MEIERKWLVEGYPPDGLYPCVRSSVQMQGYLATNPAVRVRETRCEGVSEYVLCIKGKGTLAREEIELELDKETFDRLCALLCGALVRKDHRVYRLPTGELLEVSLVDADRPTAFYYAEVEFDSMEQANAFVPPAYLGEEKTEDPAFSMSSYWRKTCGEP